MIEPAENQEVEIAESKESDALPEEKEEQYMSVSDNQLEEYNPDDEMEGDEEGSYSYGWGYSDSFDDPEEESMASDYGDLDEDELYARGIKPKN